jgi:hypothetical protein
MSGHESISCERREAWPPDAILSAPLAYLAAERAGQRALASLLERFADGLPTPPRASALFVAAARLRRCALTLVPLEDDLLVAPLEALEDRAAPSRQIAELVRRKGAVLAGQALELADILESLAQGGALREAEALGYMLRECFESLRRRAEWIEAAILPQLAPLLDEPVLRAVGEKLAAACATETLSARNGLAVIDGARRSPPRKAQPALRLPQ